MAGDGKYVSHLNILVELNSNARNSPAFSREGTVRIIQHTDSLLRSMGLILNFVLAGGLSGPSMRAEVKVLGLAVEVVGMVDTAHHTTSSLWLRFAHPIKLSINRNPNTAPDADIENLMFGACCHR